MKYFLILIIAMVFISCEESEIVYDYPDGISKPENNIKSSGCGNIFVYQFLDSLKALTVSLNAKKYNLTKKRQDFDIDLSNPDISVVLEISGGHPDSVYFTYCIYDYPLPNEGVTKKYKAASGKLSISVSEDNPIKEPIWKSSYYVTIRIRNLHFYIQGTNDEISLDEVIFWNVYVGWAVG